jgi:hypothetical protein
LLDDVGDVFEDDPQVVHFGRYGLELVCRVLARAADIGGELCE